MKIYDYKRPPLDYVSDEQRKEELANNLPCDIPLGNGVILDLLDAPHVLIAGATGTGKSVAINTILTSLLYQCNSGLELYLIDPKRIELIRYRRTPFTRSYADDVTSATNQLKYLVNLMNKRYKAMQKQGIYLWTEGVTVLVIDEYADLISQGNKKEIERLLIQLSSKGRSAGIHIILATQQPLATIISTPIKANFPVRYALKVATSSNSRVILDRAGAEKLRGKGHAILYKSDGTMIEFQGYYTPINEVDKVTTYASNQVPRTLTQIIKNYKKGLR